jgi:CheY-like chemotaxis protein
MNSPNVSHSSSIWPDLTGIHVFLVEDNQDTRTMVGETLLHCGAIVTIYQSADVAISEMTELAPTVFISDLSMPGLDGLQFMRRIRTRPPARGGRAPSLAITAYYEDFVAAEAMEAGFNAYMTKPIELEHMCHLVKDLAARG